MTPPALELDRVSLELGGNEVLSGVSLEVAPGERAALLGPSGSGKTSLLRAICGFATPVAGRIAIGGSTVFGAGVDLSPRQRRVAMVFQSYALWPHQTVRQHLEWVAARPESVSEWLSRTGLQRLSERTPGQLSGGEQARLSLARAMVAESQLLLLDEPFRHLDAPLAASLREEWRKWVEETGVATLWVTHDQREALQLADRVHLLQQGRVVASGSPRDLYAYPADAVVASLLGAGGPIEGTVRGDVLATALGDLTLARDHSEAMGERPGIAWVRPEDLVVEVDPGGQGTITAATFAGDSHHLEVEVEGTSYAARVPSDRSLEVGTRVAVSVRRPVKLLAREVHA